MIRKVLLSDFKICPGIPFYFGKVCKSPVRNFILRTNHYGDYKCKQDQCKNHNDH